MSHRRAVLLMVLATLLWSIAGVVTRHLDAARSFEVTFWRSLFNAATLMIVLSVLRGAGFWRHLLGNRIIWFSGLCWAVMYTAFMVALTLTSVANVLVTMAFGPLLTALFARIFLHHRLPIRTWIAIVVAMLGIAWMFADDAAQGSSMLGSLVALAVPVAAAINWSLMQGQAALPQGTESAKPDLLLAVLLGALLSALFTLPLAWPLDTSTHDIAWLAMLGAVQLAAPCLLVVRAAQVLPAAEVALLGLLEVIFGVALAWLGANEVPSTNSLIGGALVLVALVSSLVSRNPLRSPT